MQISSSEASLADLCRTPSKFVFETLRLWGPETVSPYATCVYSRMRPPSRSRWEIAVLSLARHGSGVVTVVAPVAVVRGIDAGGVGCSAVRTR